MVEPKTNRSATAPQWRRYLGTSAVTAFTTNLVWEMTQMRAYRDLASQPWWDTLGRCTVAAGADVLLTLIAYGIGTVVSRNTRWAWEGGVKTYCVLAAFGFAIAVIGEYVGLRTGEWSYNEEMPIVPGFNVGAWPVLQLTLLIPFAFAVGNAARRRATQVRRRS